MRLIARSPTALILGVIAIAGLACGTALELPSSSPDDEGTRVAATPEETARNRRQRPTVQDPLRGTAPTPPEQEAADTHVLTVRVVAAETGEPVAGASLELRSGPRLPFSVGGFDRLEAADLRLEASTGPDGRVRFDAVPDALQLEFHADAAGRVPVTSDVRWVDGGEDNTFELQLELGTVLTGEVREATTGAPVVGAVLEAAADPDDRSTDWRGSVTARTDADGRFALDAVPGSTRVVLSVTRAGRGKAQRVLQSAAAGEQAEPLLIELGRPGSITGVCEMGGRPVGGAHVYASTEDDGGIARQLGRWPWPAKSLVPNVAAALSDVDGTFTLEGLESGIAYTLYAVGGERDTGYSRALRSDVRAVAGEGQPETRLPLVPFARVEVRLLDETGAPLRELENIHWYGASHGGSRSSTDADGWCVVAPELGGLTPGPRVLTAKAQGMAPIALSVEVPETGVVRREHRTAAARSITGRLVYPSGRPVQLARLAAMPVWDPQTAELPAHAVSQQAVSTTTDMDGSFTLSGLGNRPYRVAHGPRGREWTTVGLVTPPLLETEFVTAGEGTLELRLTVAAGQSPPREIRAAWQRTEDPALPFWRHATVAWGEPGTQRIDPITAGHQRIRLWSEGFQPLAFEVHVEHGRTVQSPELTLRPAISVPGRVTDAAGRPVAGAEVVLGDDDLRWVRREHSLTSGEGGRFVIRGVGEGLLDVTVRLEGHRTWRREVNVSAGMPELQVDLPPGERVTFVARNPQGVRLSGARFAVRAVGATTRPIVLADTSSGRIRTSLPAGRYEVTVGVAGLPERMQQFEVKEGEDLRVEIDYAALESDER